MALQRQPLVSIVTPVYNGEAFLRACIESVLAQTYTNWDYTIVDNCSTDGTPAIAHEYAARDSRIKVHRNASFVRVIENYNNAYRRISPDSEYCKVIAADDLLLPECLERMVGLAEQHSTVGIVAAYVLMDDAVVWSGLPYPSTVIEGRTLCRQRLLGAPYIFGTASALLWRSEIVRTRPAFLNEDNLHADSEACLEFLADHDFGFVHQILTVQGKREGSLTSFSQRFRTYLPQTLHELVTYGPKYLDEHELNQRIRQHLRRYYAYLGEQALTRRDAQFWSFHRAKLAAAGHPLNRAWLAAAAGYHVLDVALSLNRGMELIRRKVFRLLSGSRT